MYHKRYLNFSIVLIILVVAGLACGFGGGSDAGETSEVEAATSGSISAEGKAGIVDEASTETEAVTVESKAEADADQDAEPSNAAAIEAAAQETVAEEIEAVTEVAVEADTPGLSIKPGSYIYTNGNFVRDIAVHDGVLWAATEGGVVAWDIATGEATKYTTLDGLPSSEIHAVTACPVPEMTIIVGTGAGLSLYDPASDSWVSGEKLIGSQEPDVVAATLDIFGAADDIRLLHCDAQNGRLFFDDDDLAILDINSGEISQISEDDGLPWAGIDAVAVANDGIWVASGFKGVSYISGDNITVYSEENNNFSDNYVDMLGVSSDGSVWMAGDEGLFHVNNGQFTHYTEEDSELFRLSLSGLAVAPDDKLWIETNEGICQFDPGTISCVALYDREEGMASGSLSRLLADDEGNLYYSTYENGVSMFDGSTWRHFLLENELVDSSEITAIAQDTEGYIWIGTNEDGITRVNPEATEWTIYTRDNSNLDWNGVDDIQVDLTGRVWILQGFFPAYFGGTDWVRVDPGEAIDHLGSATQAFSVDEQGRIWIGGGGGLAILDGDTFTRFGEAEGWGDNDTNVRAFLPDGDVMWVSTTDGLLRFEGDQHEFVIDEETPGLSDDNVGVMAQDVDGMLLLGTIYDGVALFDGQTVAPIPDLRGSVASIFVKEDGRKLMGVGGEVLYFDGDSWNRITREDGLPTGYVVATLLDDQGTVWMGGFGGLMRIVP